MSRPLSEILDDLNEMEDALRREGRAVTAPGKEFIRSTFEDAFKRVEMDLPFARPMRTLIDDDAALVAVLRYHALNPSETPPATLPPGYVW